MVEKERNEYVGVVKLVDEGSGGGKGGFKGGKIVVCINDEKMRGEKYGDL